MIDQHDVEYLEGILDNRYVLIEDCNSKRKEVEKYLHRDDTRLALIEQQQKVNNWLTLAIAGGIITLVIKVFLGG